MKLGSILLVLPAVFIPIALIAQGPLTPPAGPPGPVMKTLQQVEPRTDVATLAGDAAAQVVISAPGSYYLSGNVAAAPGKAGIAIGTSNVTLDLSGFTITGVTGSTRGVEFRPGAGEVKVSRGVITGFPSGPGVGLAPGGVVGSDVHLEDLTIRNCAGGVLIEPVEDATANRVRVVSATNSGMELNAKSLASHCIIESGAGTLAVTMIGIRGGTVDHCEVNGFTSQNSSAIGILATAVTHCNVSALTATGGGTSGINAPFVAHCRVAGVNLTSGTTLVGINAQGGRIADCVVDAIGVTGGSTPTGISGGNVSGCMVRDIGGSGTAGTITGINATSSVSDCAVTTLGVAAAPASISGISGQLVSHCRVSTLACSEGITGITADTATNCSVETLAQSGSPTGSVTGISALQIVDCKAGAFTGGSGSGAVNGCVGLRMASGCSVHGLSTGGTGIITGFNVLSNGKVTGCTVDGTATYGILANVGGSIKGCNIRLNGSGNGISSSASLIVVEDNLVTNCGTGINISGTSGLIVRNRVGACTTNIVSSATTQVGPVVNATGTIASTNPWANFTD